MICYRCGSANDAGSRFCNNCAAPFKADLAQWIPEGNAWKWILGILGGLCILIALGSLVDRSSSPQTPEASTPAVAPPGPVPKAARITASVRFTGTQFIITNNDTYDWTSVKLEINGGLFSGGYELKHPLIKAGETYIVGALQFADSDGTRFNPFQEKPNKFSICGLTPYGFDCYVGGWD